jgi:hypothetical protein
MEESSANDAKLNAWISTISVLAIFSLAQLLGKYNWFDYPFIFSLNIFLFIMFMLMLFNSSAENQYWHYQKTFHDMLENGDQEAMQDYASSVSLLAAITSGCMGYWQVALLLGAVSILLDWRMYSLRKAALVMMGFMLIGVAFVGMSGFIAGALAGMVLADALDL